MIQFLLVSSFALITKSESPRFIPASVAQVELPAYVEERNSVQFKVSAEFPNECYKFGPPMVRFDRDRDVFLFHVSAYEAQSGCEKHPTVQSQMVDLGKLHSGSYEIRELKSLKNWGKIEVEHFEASADASSHLEFAQKSR